MTHADSGWPLPNASCIIVHIRMIHLVNEHPPSSRRRSATLFDYFWSMHKLSFKFVFVCRHHLLTITRQLARKWRREKAITWMLIPTRIYPLKIQTTRETRQKAKAKLPTNVKKARAGERRKRWERVTSDNDSCILLTGGILSLLHGRLLTLDLGRPCKKMKPEACKVQWKAG